MRGVRQQFLEHRQGSPEQAALDFARVLVAGDGDGSQGYTVESAYVASVEIFCLTENQREHLARALTEDRGRPGRGDLWCAEVAGHGGRSRGGSKQAERAPWWP